MIRFALLLVFSLSACTVHLTPERERFDDLLARQRKVESYQEQFEPWRQTFVTELRARLDAADQQIAELERRIEDGRGEPTE
jgi:uncharacterized protein YceH (UPF0502 family)